MPVDCPTVVLNPLIACLAGGRNKIVAAKAYDAYNSELAASGLAIQTPLTVRDVKWADLAGWVAKLGGFACIKVPYSNAGQGVYTITSPAEFEAFQRAEAGSRYRRYIVQSLISNHEWSSSLDGRAGAGAGAAGGGGGHALLSDAPRPRPPLLPNPPRSRHYHVGTIPDKRGNIYVADLCAAAAVGRAASCARSNQTEPNQTESNQQRQSSRPMR